MTKFVSILLVLLPILVFPQPAEAANKSVYSSSPFDSSANKLTPNFQGHDALKIYQILEKRRLSTGEKDEFETSEQYAKRVEAEWNKPILGSLSTSSLLAFKANSCEASYDADGQVFTLQCRLTPFLKFQLISPGNREAIPEDLKTVNWSSEKKDLGSYMGTNAFGATVQVHRKEETSVDIAVHNADDFIIEIHKCPPPFESIFQEYFEARLRMPPEEARSLKSSVGALLISQLTSPFLSECYDHDEPTYVSPWDRISTTYNLHVRVFEVWFYDSRTGEVISRIKPREE